MATTVKLHLLRVGACRHLECMAARGGRWAMMDFPALCGLIQHPTRGWILFDMGYAEHFFTATEHLPALSDSKPISSLIKVIRHKCHTGCNPKMADDATLISPT
ncbi:MAG: hypothetical protein RI964_1826 [Pseudomonadota bacterium]|jgi:hypothetical protein